VLWGADWIYTLHVLSGIWHGDGNRYDITVEPNEYGRVNVTASLVLPENELQFTNGERDNAKT
jgi:hypothetical protein